MQVPSNTWLAAHLSRGIIQDVTFSMAAFQPKPKFAIDVSGLSLGTGSLQNCVMKSLVLHIGPHKTGSTYIQRRLFDNAEKLESAGVAYPSTGINFLYGHHQIARLAGQGEPSKLRALLEPLAELGAPVLILSSENFDRLKRDGIAKLALALPVNRKVTVVYFRRDLTDLLVSKWQEAVKHGETQSFHEFVEPHISRPFSSQTLNHCLVLDRYRDQFGLTSIKVIDYDDAAAAGDMFDAFSRACECPKLAQVGEFGVFNQSMPIWEVELLRALNTTAQHEGLLRGTNVRASWLSYKRANKESSELKPLLAEAAHLILTSTREFSIRDSHSIRTMERHFLDTYGAQIQPLSDKLGTGGSTKSHAICLTQWLGANRSPQIVSSLFDALRPELAMLANRR
jgi:hypothetical protein